MGRFGTILGKPAFSNYFHVDKDEIQKAKLV